MSFKVTTAGNLTVQTFQSFICLENQDLLLIRLNEVMFFGYLDHLEVTDQFDQSIIFLNKTFSIFRMPESEKYFKLLPN